MPHSKLQQDPKSTGLLSKFLPFQPKMLIDPIAACEVITAATRPAPRPAKALWIACVSSPSTPTVFAAFFLAIWFVIYIHGHPSRGHSRSPKGARGPSLREAIGGASCNTSITLDIS